QWMAGVQYQVAGDTVLQANYVGNHGLKLLFGSAFELNQLPVQDLSMGNALLDSVPNPFRGVITSGSLSGATIPRGQLLRPFPEYASVSDVQPPAAFTRYHALPICARRRC